jgi:hypothetical protein
VTSNDAHQPRLGQPSRRPSLLPAAILAAGIAVAVFILLAAARDSTPPPSTPLPPVSTGP